MSGREWTGSVARLDDAMVELAVQMANKATEREGTTVEELRTFLQDHAYTLSEWAAAVRELYARLDEGEGVTNAQGVAMARLLRGAKSIHAMRDVFWAPTSHLGFTLTYEDGREIVGGIEPDGSTNT